MSKLVAINIHSKHDYEHIDNYYHKVNNILKNRLCWFCERPCDDFVCICTKCKSDKFKNKKNLKQ
jgi:hypothetical protein